MELSELNSPQMPQMSATPMGGMVGADLGNLANNQTEQ
jgi:hypothetical protein